MKHETETRNNSDTVSGSLAFAFRKTCKCWNYAANHRLD